jgi:fructoselysine-6-P-deglycase FrlB-like protein
MWRSTLKLSRNMLLSITYEQKRGCGVPGQHVTEEINSQPDCWAQASEVAERTPGAFPRPGERVAVIGCGTSLFVGQAYAAMREYDGQGLTDAFPASELPPGRRYDRIVAITRSGTTTEVLSLLRDTAEVPSLAITADASTPVADSADDLVELPFADERSVVQTRFATSTLVLLRASLGHPTGSLPDDARRALAQDLDRAWETATQFTFLGRSWTVGLANEAALKVREAAGLWTEAYPAMEYRHGPISIAQASRITWMFGEPPAGLPDEVRATGAHFVADDSLDPIAQLVLAQRVAIAQALRRGLDPDHPRNLSRAVILDAS